MCAYIPDTVFEFSWNSYRLVFLLCSYLCPIWSYRYTCGIYGKESVKQSGSLHEANGSRPHMRMSGATRRFVYQVCPILLNDNKFSFDFYAYITDCIMEVEAEDDTHVSKEIDQIFYRHCGCNIELCLCSQLFFLLIFRFFPVVFLCSLPQSSYLSRNLPLSLSLFFLSIYLSSSSFSSTSFVYQHISRSITFSECIERPMP